MEAPRPSSHTHFPRRQTTLWTDNFTPMLPVQPPTSQPGSDSHPPTPDTGEAPREEVKTQNSSANTFKRSRPSWCRELKRYLDEWQRVTTTSAPTRFIQIFVGQGGLGKAFQSHGHIVRSFDIKTVPIKIYWTMPVRSKCDNL